MSCIPNCREEYKTNYRGEKTEEKNGYWEGNLTEDNKTLIKGYDWCVEDIEFIEFEDFDEVPEEVSVKDAKLVFEAFKEWLLERIELDRNETVVSLIEDQPEEEE